MLLDIAIIVFLMVAAILLTVSYTHLRAHETL